METVGLKLYQVFPKPKDNYRKCMLNDLNHKEAYIDVFLKPNYIKLYSKHYPDTFIFRLLLQNNCKMIWELIMHTIESTMQTKLWVMKVKIIKF